MHSQNGCGNFGRENPRRMIVPRKGQRDPVKEQRWRRILRDWQRSGLSVIGYCRQHQLKYYSFRDWRKVIEERDLESKGEVSLRQKRKTRHQSKKALPDNQSNTEPVTGFAPVRLVGNIPTARSSDSSSVLEIVLTTGTILRVNSTCPLPFLQSVVSLLEVS